MKPEDVKKLLGGYATGTLTEEERRALFQAALRDQDLFDALADEHALKELLDDPKARRELLSALEQKREPLLQRFSGWLTRPTSWAVAGGVAAAVLVAVIVTHVGSPPIEPDVTLVAKRTAPPAPELPSPPALESKSEQRQVVEREAVAKRQRPAHAGEGAELAVSASKVGEAERADLPPPPAAAPPAEEQIEMAKLEPPHEAMAEEAAPTAIMRDEARAKARGAQYAAEAPSAPSATVAGAVTNEEAVKTTAAQEVFAARKPADQRVGEADALAAPQQAPSIRYRILRARGADFEEVESQTSLDAGDSIRVSIEPSEDGYLDVTLQEPDASRETLFFRRVEKGKTYTVPSKGAIPAGDRKLVVTFSRQRPPRAMPTSLVRGAADQRSLVVVEIPLGHQ